MLDVGTRDVGGMYQLRNIPQSKIIPLALDQKILGIQILKKTGEQSDDEKILRFDQLYHR